MAESMGNYRPRDIGEKYAKNDLKGRKAFNEDGVKEFGEWPEKWKTEFSTVLVFDEATEKLIEEQLISKILAKGQELGFEFAIAGRDYPMHSTLQPGMFEGDQDARTEAYEKMAADTKVAETAEKLAGKEIEYKYLLTNADSITLNSTAIPSEVREFRESIDAAGKANNVAVGLWKDILHISLMRITHLPEENREAKMAEFKKFLIDLRHEISSKPVIAKTDHAFIGQGVMYKKRSEL